MRRRSCGVAQAPPGTSTGSGSRGTVALATVFPRALLALRRVGPVWISRGKSQLAAVLVPRCLQATAAEAVTLTAGPLCQWAGYIYSSLAGTVAPRSTRCDE